MHIFQVEEVTFAEFWIEIEVADMPLLGERLRVLEFYWPDGIIRCRKSGGSGGIGPNERNHRIAMAIVEPAHSIRSAVPSRIQELVAVLVDCQVAIGLIAKNRTSVVENDVEDHAHAVGVSSVNEVFQLNCRT